MNVFEVPNENQELFRNDGLASPTKFIFNKKRGKKLHLN